MSKLKPIYKSLNSPSRKANKRERFCDEYGEFHTFNQHDYKTANVTLKDKNAKRVEFESIRTDDNANDLILIVVLFALVWMAVLL